MGANCCVAARSKPMPHRITCDVSSYRNARHSPSWSLRWDTRTHIEDIMDSSPWRPQNKCGNIGSGSKSAADTETEGLSEFGSPLYAHQTSNWGKKVDIAGSSKSMPTDLSTRSNSSPEGKGIIKSSSTTTAIKPSISLPSTPSFKAIDPSSSRACSSFHSAPSSSKKARHSPGNQLYREVSESRHDLFAGGSHGGSSDDWSMRTFSELVAASASFRRKRWSFDSENPSSFTSTMLPRSLVPPADIQTCSVCSKLLKEKSPWSVQKLVSTDELEVAAVLVCGHVYHADCLENITSEIDRYDPPCPLCANVETLSKKNKISRRAVADIDVNGLKWGGKSRSIGPSSSGKGSFGRPFLRRHFSVGSQPPLVQNTEFEGEVMRKKKSFWGRYGRD